MTASDPELDRLDAVIAEHEARDTPADRGAAAEALLAKADHLSDREGDAIAFPLYEQVVRRLEGASDAESRATLLYALNAIAHIHRDAGRVAECRLVAGAAVEGHLDQAPREARAAVGNLGLLLANLYMEAGEIDQALALLDRLVGVLGDAASGAEAVTVAKASCNAGRILADRGRPADSAERYGRAVEVLMEPTDDEATLMLADALAHQAHQLYDAGQREQADECCREMLRRFRRATDPVAREQVAWARDRLELPRAAEPRRGWRRRA